MTTRREVLAGLTGVATSKAPTLLPGDVIFGRFPRSRWAQLAASFSSDRSGFGHVGVIDAIASDLIVDADGNPAGGRVSVRSLAAFLSGADHVEVRRLRLAAAQRRAVALRARSWAGVPFDAAMTLAPDKLYCTELVWRACLAATGQDLVPHKTVIAFRDVITIADLRQAALFDLVWKGAPDRL